VKPLWSCRQTVEVMSKFKEEIGLRHASLRLISNHLQCWLNIESIT
jgi:hypothetical protein